MGTARLVHAFAGVCDGMGFACNTGLSPIWLEKSVMVLDPCRLYCLVSKHLHFKELVKLGEEALQVLGT